MNQVPGTSEQGEPLRAALDRAEAGLRESTRALVVRLEVLAAPPVRPREPLDRLLRALGEGPGRLVVRTSQLAALAALAGLPQVRVLCLSPLHDAESMLLTAAREDEQTVVLYEPPELLELPLQLELGLDSCAEPFPYPTRLIRAPGPPALTLSCTGPDATTCLKLLAHLPGCELLVPIELQPLRLSAWEDSLRRSDGRLLTVGALGPCWPGELVAACSEAGWLSNVDCLPQAEPEAILQAARRLIDQI